MFACLAQGDHLYVIPMLGVGHVDHTSIEETNQIDPLFSIGFAVILLSQR